jgi:hypothetical protein
MIRSKTLLGLMLAAGTALLGTTARASDDFIVYSPYVTEGQSEVEFRTHQQFDTDPTLDNERAYVVSVAHAFNSWWQPEIYLGRYERDPGSTNTFEGYEFENVFQLTEQGHYWADFGFLASYEYNKLPDQPGVLEFGPLFEKRTGNIDHRFNMIWEKDVGGGASRHYEFRASYAATYRITAMLQPGLEAYYRPDDDSHQIGPALNGEIASAGGNEFEYHIAYLFGLNQQAANGTLAIRFEYEFN